MITPRIDDEQQGPIHDSKKRKPCVHDCGIGHPKYEILTEPASDAEFIRAKRESCDIFTLVDSPSKAMDLNTNP